MVSDLRCSCGAERCPYFDKARRNPSGWRSSDGRVHQLVPRLPPGSFGYREFFGSSDWERKR